MRKILLILSVFFIFNNTSFAEGNVFPFPKGNVYVTNGYGGSSTHQGDYYYSLDFRAYDTANRCDSYGAPVLAARSGVVIKAVNPGSKKINGGYGVHVYVKHDDNSVLRYAHMIDGSLAIKKREKVRQGQILGLLGATGNTAGMECHAFDGVNNGAHLHFESRDKDNSTLNPEPMAGKEGYTNISIAGNPYISTTLMYDPNNHWGRCKNKVPYRLTYSSSVIHSFSPLIVQAGEKQIFTIKGKNLFEDLTVSLSGCKGFKWIKKEADEQRFKCNMTNLKGVKTGFVRFASRGKPDFHFEVELVSEKEDIQPKITKVETIDPVADKTTDFIIKGEYLPDDLQFDLKTCANISYKKITPSYREFSCRLPHTVYSDNGKRINGVYMFNTSFISESKKYSYPLQFSVDYEVRIDKMEPLVAISGVKNIFTFTGKNLNLAKAIWMEKCDNLREIKRSGEVIQVECVPQVPDRPWYVFIPNCLKKDLYKVIFKDKPGGTTLFKSRILIFSDNNIAKPKEELEAIDEGGFLEEYDNKEVGHGSLKYNCLHNVNPFYGKLYKEDGNGITLKNKLGSLSITYSLSIKKMESMLNKGYCFIIFIENINKKDNIAFFVKKNNDKFFDSLDDLNQYDTNHYRFLVDKFDLKEVVLHIEGDEPGNILSWFTGVL